MGVEMREEEEMRKGNRWMGDKVMRVRGRGGGEEVYKEGRRKGNG